jgi:hypothetical protein
MGFNKINALRGFRPRQLPFLGLCLVLATTPLHAYVPVLAKGHSDVE